MSGGTRVLLQGRAALLRAAFWGALASCSLAGCAELQADSVVGDDTVDASRPDLRSLLASCVETFKDAGVTFVEQESVCIIAPFTEGCLLRVCAVLVLGAIEDACPSPDSGLRAPDPQFCEALAVPLGRSL